LSAKDYSFISENHLSDIFGMFAGTQAKVNMMQTSALSFSVCIDFYEERFKKLLKALTQDFNVKYNEGLTLITVRHYSTDWLNDLKAGKTILMEQLSRNTIQMVVR
jgi:aspartate kinase